MGASNWRVCPACLKRDNEKKAVLEQKIKDSYGKIPLDEWNKLQAQAARYPALGETLREDYEIGTKADGTFFVSYGASCEAFGCRYDTRYDHTEVLEKI